MFGDIMDWYDMTRICQYYLKMPLVEIMCQTKVELESCIAYFIERKKEEAKNK